VVPSVASPVAGEKPRPAAVPAAKTEPLKQKAAEPMRAPAAAVSKAKPAVSPEKTTAAKALAAKGDVSRAEKIAAAAAFPAQNAAPGKGALAAPAANLWIPAGLREVWNRADRTQRFLMAGLAMACAGSFLLLVILTIARVAGSSSPSAQNVQPAVASTSEIVADRSNPAADSSTPPVVDSDQPSPPSPFMYLVNLVFGNKSDFDDAVARQAVAIDPAHVAVPVWTSKTTGFYYCTEDEYYRLVKPGRFMNQRDALQNGYQPKLGKFCN
jgi:hypothetical protein